MERKPDEPAPGTDAATAGTMTGVVQERYGTTPADVLRPGVLPRPRVEPGKVLVRVLASSVDRGTWHLMAGLPYAVRPVTGVRAPKLPKDHLMVVNISGRGDKDLFQIAEHLGNQIV